MFDYFEGNLSLHEQIELREFVKQNPEYGDDFKEWGKARLEEDSAPLFPHASTLLVKERNWLPKMWRGAAVLLLLFSTSLLYIVSNDWNASSENVVDITSIENGESQFENPVFSGVYNNLHNSSKEDTPEPLSDKKQAVAAISAGFSAERSGATMTQDLNEVEFEKLSALELSPMIWQKSHESDDFYYSSNSSTHNEADVFVSSVVTLVDQPQMLLGNEVTLAHMMASMENEGINIDGDKEEKDRKARMKQFDRLFARKIGLTNLSDPIFIKDKGDILNVNPALIGSSGSSRFNVLCRSQWRGTGNASNRYALTYDQHVEQLHGGIGVGIERLDYEKGMYSGYSAKLGYAPRFNISREVSLSVAAAFIVNQLEVDFDNYRYDSQVELVKGDVNDTYEYGYIPRTDKIIYKDLSMGVMLNTPFCFIGGSAEHLTEPGQNLYTADLGVENKLKRKYSVQIGTDYKKNAASKLAFSPQLIFENQGGKSELWVSSSFRFNNLIAGTGISTDKSVKGILGIQGKNLRLMYSYDLTKSDLLMQTKGSHEASIRVLFNSKKTKSPLAFL
jgi:type IX secretion system PorP/SprF family membrane protein